MKNITIYTTPTCGYCHLAKEFLNSRQVPFTEKDVTQDRAAVQEMVEKSGQMGVPVIDIDGQVIVGFDQVRLIQAIAS